MESEYILLCNTCHGHACTQMRSVLIRTVILYFHYIDETSIRYTIQDLPLQSIIYEPSCDANVVQNVNKEAPLVVRGVAYSGASGSMIASVEVSVDDGLTWQPAEIMHDDVINIDDSARFFGWVRWECACTVDMMPTNMAAGTDQQAGGHTGTSKSGQIAILCRATTSDGTSQPRVGASNGGYLYNGYHKIIVPIKLH